MVEFFDKRDGKIKNLSIPAGKVAQEHRGNPHRSIQPHNSANTWASGCKQCDAQIKSGTHPSA